MNIIWTKNIKLSKGKTFIPVSENDKWENVELKHRDSIVLGLPVSDVKYQGDIYHSVPTFLYVIEN